MTEDIRKTMVCDDDFALEINRAIAEAEDPDRHTIYDTAEAFVNSLIDRRGKQ